MHRVIDHAKAKGLRRVYGDVLAENASMLQMCAELGFYAQEMGPDLKRVVLDLETSAASDRQPSGAATKH
jgi:acetyltransferase